jgi:predicted RNA-binding protein with TRAM domain
VPKDVRHCPVAEGGDVIAMIIEKVGTLNSGDAGVVEGFTNQVEDVREK